MWRVGEEVELGLLIHLGVDTIGAAAVGNMSDSFTAELLDMPHTMVRDVQRRASRRVRDLEG
jgi:hypothetical protein